jgi:hypothetical protein
MTQQRKGTLTVYGCHCAYNLAIGEIYAEHPNDRPIYEAHIVYAFKHLEWRSNVDPLLIITGGSTKHEVNVSESRSNIDLARVNNIVIPSNVALEEYALTSIENVLFSIYCYCMITGFFPERIDVISWEFKRNRYEATLNAINRWEPLGQSWESLNFFPVGDLFGTAKKNALMVEDEYIGSLNLGLPAYYANPITQQRIRERDPHNSRSGAKEYYASYPLPF